MIMVKILNYAKNINRNVNDNLLINGNFDVWQRGTPFYAGGFTADRWYLVSNGANKASRIAGNIGLDNATNHIRLTTLSSGSYPVLSQAVDSDITSGLRGKSAIFSFYAKKPSESNWTGLVYGKVYYSTDFDSLANGKAEIVDAAFSGTLLTDSWTLYSKSFTVPNNASTLMVEISPSGGLNNASIIDIGRAKLELGSVVTSFKPVISNEELNRCKRFYQKVEAKLKAGTGAGNNTKKFGVSTPLPVTPRSNTAKITVAQNSNNLIESFTASISNDSYLNVFAESKQPYSELNLEFYIDSEIPYGKPPGIINSVTTIRGSGKVDIDWNPPTNSDNTISYSILYGTNPSETTNIISFTDSSGSITGLVDSSSYYFKLFSTNYYGQSDFSNTFEVAPAYTTPSIVSSLTGIWGFDTSHISWTIPTGNGGSPITGYRIDRSMYSNFPDVATAPNYNSTFYVPHTSLSFNISKFNNELTSTGNYHFRVAAMNLAGTGTPRSISVPKTVPTAPINLSSSVGDGFVTLSYLPPTGNGGNTISLVNVDRSTTSTFTNAVSTVHTADYQSISITGLTNNTTYYFRMRAYNQIGYGSYSSGILAVPNRPVTVPNPPSGFNAGWVDDDTVSLSWNPPSDNGGSPIINYTIYASSGSGFTSNLLTLTTQNSISSITFDIPITGNYNTFYFRGKANNSVGSSNNSSIFSLAKQVPAISPLNFMEAIGDSSLTYSWQVPISRGSAITGYNVQYSTDSTFNTNVTNIFTTGTKVVITSLTNNTMYCLRVRALNIIGTGSFTNPGNCATPVSPYSAPTAPTNVTVGEIDYSSPNWTLPVNASSFNGYALYAGWRYAVPINNSYQTTNFTYGGIPFTGQVYGSNPYMSFSDFRRAAVHAGVFSSLSSTGILYIYGGITNDFLVGSTINNITSLNSLSTISLQQTFNILGASTNTGCYYTKGGVNGVTTNTHAPLLNWSGPSNNGGLPITGYEIQYAANSSFSSQLTTLSVPGRLNYHTQCIAHSGVDLYARVRAYNATGVSPWSNTAILLGKGLGAPLPPVSASATAVGTTGINLSWTAPSGPIGSGFDSSANIGYRLQYWNQASPTSQTSINYGAGITSATVPINGPGTYTLQLQTKNSVYFSTSLNTILTVNPSNPTPISWVFTTSTPCCAAASPSLLVDALRDNTNSAGSTFSSCAGTYGSAFITADFGSIKNIRSIKIRPHYTYGEYYLNHTKLQYSADGSVWTTLMDFATFTGSSAVFKGSTTEVPINLNINTRYIRLISGNVSCIDLSEFKFE